MDCSYRGSRVIPPYSDRVQYIAIERSRQYDTIVVCLHCVSDIDVKLTHSVEQVHNIR